ncbi:unnamed protein product [Arabidopsis halleri]
MDFVGLSLLSFVVALFLGLYTGTFEPAIELAGNLSLSEKRPMKNESVKQDSELLTENFYRESCPSAERIIRSSIRVMYDAKPGIAPSLVRLLFHDCFIGGCDASVLLDTDKAFASEKEAPPNLSLKGFDVLETIKSKLENVCPGVVSCADILALAARESVQLTGGPRFLVKTGRRDRTTALKDAAGRELPAPQANLSVVLRSFASKGFTARETVALLGAHSIGITHCEFFEDRLYNFSGTGKPDPELNPVLLQELKTKCPFSASISPPSATTGSTPSLDDKTYTAVPLKSMVIDLSFNNEGGQADFGIRYYRGLMQKKGVMFADQQLMAKDETARWVRAYAHDSQRFRKDFAKAMTKLTNLQILTAPLGEVRKQCSKVLNTF